MKKNSMIISISKTIKQVLRYLNEIRATYKNSLGTEYVPTSEKHDLVLPLQYLATLYRCKNEHAKAAECYMEAFELTKECTDYSILILMLLEAADSYNQCDMFDKAQLCLSEAHSYLGTNKPYFELVANLIKSELKLTHS